MYMTAPCAKLICFICLIFAMCACVVCLSRCRAWGSQITLHCAAKTGWELTAPDAEG